MTSLACRTGVVACSGSDKVIVQGVPENSDRNFLEEQERLDARRQLPFRATEPRVEVARGEDWWLFTYRTWSVVEYIDQNGRRFHPSERVRLQPWWGVPQRLFS